MAMRAYWSGNLRLSLVTVPVRLYAATEAGAKLTLHKIHEPTGERVRYQNVVPDHGPVEADEIVKGYEYDKNRYVKIDPDELDKIKLESKKTIDVVQFVERHEIAATYYERPYYLVPDGAIAEEAYLTIREALRQSKKTGLGQLVLNGRERLAAISPCDRGILLETLRYADEVREANRVFADIKEHDLDPDQLDLAKELIQRKAGSFKPEEFKDRYREQLKELIEAKIEERDVDLDEPKRESAKVINLMDALKKSLDKTDGGAGSGNGGGAKGSGGKGGARKPAAKKSASKGAAKKTASKSTAKKAAPKRKSA
jgi:DNA end-binding protein Ku